MTQHTKMRIVGFTGKSGSGKDTSAAILAGMSDARRVRSTAFVEPLKNAAKILFCFSQEQLYANIEKEDPRWGKSPSQVFDWLENDVLRKQVDKDFFIKNMQMRINNAKKQGIDLFIITDVQFDNEAEFLLSQGGSVVHLSRAGAEAGRVGKPDVSDHLITHRIANHGTLEELENAVYALFENPFSMYALEDSLPSSD
jgi:energy-coupling factor transporter ATP-binding protein EcfA2